MIYQPIIPVTGNAGWNFLKSTREMQQTAFNESSQIKSNVEYFTQNIQDVLSPSDLIDDRRLLMVALGAFGLSEDINNAFFVQKVLQEGTLSDDSFANRLSDKRYFELSQSFGFDLSPPKTVLSDFANTIVNRFQKRSFEEAVGQSNGDLRIALSFSREVEYLSTNSSSVDAAWFTVLGNPPLRRVLEKALGLPSQSASIQIDRQLSIFKEKAEKIFGVSDPRSFTEENLKEKIIQIFLLRSNMESLSVTTTKGSVALSLLQNAQNPS